MSWSSEWDRLYRAGMHMSVWPWSDLVSYVMKYCRPTGNDFQVLELGCGAGANIPFFQSLGADYHGIDGSQTIIDMLRIRFPALARNLVVGDFTLDLGFTGQFDLVIDRAALTHNDSAAISRCLDSIHAHLKKQGKLIAIDWFSTDYSDFRRGKVALDTYTRDAYTDGSFADVGKVHFSDKVHIQELFKRFEIVVLEHKTVQRHIPGDDWRFASWNLVARKQQ